MFHHGKKQFLMACFMNYHISNIIYIVLPIFNTQTFPKIFVYTNTQILCSVSVVRVNFCMHQERTSQMTCISLILIGKLMLLFHIGSNLDMADDYSGPYIHRADVIKIGFTIADNLSCYFCLCGCLRPWETEHG